MSDCEQCAALQRQNDFLANDRDGYVQLLTDENNKLRAQVDTAAEMLREAKARNTALRAENEKLRAALREAYEVYAGSDGFIPETAGEGYQQQIIRQMVNCISAALEGKQ